MNRQLVRAIEGMPQFAKAIMMILQVVKATVNGNSLEGEAQSPNVFNQVKGTRR